MKVAVHENGVPHFSLLLREVGFPPERVEGILPVLRAVLARDRLEGTAP